MSTGLDIIAEENTVLTKRKSDEITADEDEPEEQDSLCYRKTRLMKFETTVLKPVLKNLKKLHYIQCSGHRGDYQTQAYRFHKHNLEPFLLGKCEEEIHFKNNDELNKSIKKIESTTVKIVRDYATVYDDKEVFFLFYKRAIHSDYYDEDEFGGDAEYKSDSDGYGYREYNDESGHEDDE